MEHEKQWEVKGTLKEKEKKLLGVKKYLTEKGARSVKNFDKYYYGTWFSYSLGKAEIKIWTHPYDALEFLVSDADDHDASDTDDSDTSYYSCKKSSTLCPACPANRKYIISVQSKENIDDIVKELSSLIQ